MNERTSFLPWYAAAVWLVRLTSIQRSCFSTPAGKAGKSADGSRVGGCSVGVEVGVSVGVEVGIEVGVRVALDEGVNVGVGEFVGVFVAVRVALLKLAAASGAGSLDRNT